MVIAEIDRQHCQLSMKASIFLYGDAASSLLSEAVANDIANHWNEPQATVLIKSVLYKIVFNIKGVYAPDLKPIDVYVNDDPANNYFRVEEYCELDISFVDDIGSNTGYFKLANLLNNSTTAAHEFGHTLGLEHPLELDIRGSGTPGIMYPRGSITDSHYQYDPAAAPATKGGTLNPFYRKVLQQDLDGLHLNKLHFNTNNQAIVGDFSSVWHDKHLPL